MNIRDFMDYCGRNCKIDLLFYITQTERLFITHSRIDSIRQSHFFRTFYKFFYHSVLDIHAKNPAAGPDHPRKRQTEKAHRTTDIQNLHAFFNIRSKYLFGILKESSERTCKKVTYPYRAYSLGHTFTD